MAAVAVLLLTTVAAAGWAVSGEYSDYGAFDSAAWRAGAADAAPGNEWSSDNPRYHMAAELIESHLQPGIARSEVLELLGPPDYDQDGTLHYMIGANPYHIDPDGVVITFDAADRLASATIVQY